MSETKNVLKRMMHLSLLASMGFAALLYWASARHWPQTAPPLGTAQSFAVLGAAPSVTNTGPTIVTGDLGVSPGYRGHRLSSGDRDRRRYTQLMRSRHQAQSDITTAYNVLAGQACNTI